MERFKIIKIKDGKKSLVRDLVTQEVYLKIVVRKKEIASFLCSPFNLKELLRGYLYLAGFINDIRDIKRIFVKRKGNVALANILLRNLKSNSLGKILPDLIKPNKEDKKVSTKDILRLMKRFQKASLEFKKTGGVHSAALCTHKEILIFQEDLSRHNAIDKVIGKALRQGIDFSDKLLFTSGRVSSEIIQKVLRCKITCLISVSAPTDQAIKLADKFNLTLIAFARGNKMNIYANKERLVYA